MYQLNCKYCRSPNVKLIESDKNTETNYITNVYICQNCDKSYKSYELLDDKVYEKNCLLCSNKFVTVRKSTKYCETCKVKANLIRASGNKKSSSERGKKQLEEMEKTILENVKKFTKGFVRVDNFDEMTHYLYNFMEKSHPKKAVEDSILSQKVMYKYFKEGAIIGFKFKKEEK